MADDQEDEVTDDLDAAKTEGDLEDLEAVKPKIGEDTDMVPDEEYLK